MKNEKERNSNDNNKKPYNKSSNNPADPNAITSTIADLWQRYSPIAWSEMYNEYINYIGRMTEIYDEYAKSSERMTELYKESAKSTEKMSKKWLNQFWKPLSEKGKE